MRPLSGEMLLTVWETGAQEGYLGRILAMLSTSMPDRSSDQLSKQTLHTTLLDLLRLRSISFGPILEGFLLCPACDARLEFSLPVASVMEDLERAVLALPQQQRLGDTAFFIRPASLYDLVTVNIGSFLSARKHLLARCIASSDAHSEDDILLALDEEIFEELALDAFDRMEFATEVIVHLQCAECSITSSVDLDIARFLWAEVRHAATSLLGEVHELARAYGWAEASILAMSPNRRNAYLEMML
ncbi:hypothetical protein [Granulicella sp. dw_53]|uniref:hypothetical protein n=1 Tax=Granulicella sp. dw_53 TaxID=2719792 RepID=UPI001BD4473F|nr:hypothetical protein [Granulicella sp. dw_53]